MNAQKSMQLLMEMDQQVISPRPSMFGKAAETVRKMAAHIDQPGADVTGLLGDWRSVDLSAAQGHAPRDPKFPILDSIDKAHGAE